MKHMNIFPYGGTQALPFAVRRLQLLGANIVKAPTAEVTHLLLPVPSFEPDGRVRGGAELGEVLKNLPRNITILGGHLEKGLPEGYKKVDLLLDEQYLADNAHLTAECAMQVVRELLPVQLRRLPVLVIGWGRIGKCLGKLLQQAGAEVTVAARKEKDRAMLRALGYEALSMEQMYWTLSNYRVILNTVPSPVLSREELLRCRDNCIKIDLASVPGMEGADVIAARGLPGKYLPESSGQLIGDAVLRLCGKDEAL